MGGVLDGQAVDAREIPWSLRESLWGAVPISVLILLSWLAKFVDTSHVQSDPNQLLWPTIIGTAVTFAILLIPVYVIAIRRHKATMADLGFRALYWSRARGVIGWVLAVDLAQSFLWIPLLRHPRATPLYFGKGWKGSLIAVAIIVIATPVVEELFFRGFLFPGLRARFSFWIAAAISGLMFGLGHDAIWPQAISGLLLAWLRERTLSLWPGIVVHAGVNLIVIGAAVFAITRKA